MPHKAEALRAPSRHFFWRNQNHAAESAIIGVEFGRPAGENSTWAMFRCPHVVGATDREQGLLMPVVLTLSKQENTDGKTILET